MKLAPVAACFGILATSFAAHAEAPVRMRIVSWNVWGVPVITPALDERIAAAPEALLTLEPDVVCLQELWEARHAESVARGLAAKGLRHFRRFEGPDGRTGLFIASKWALLDARFRPFSLGGTPHSLWHLDWMVEKGVASVTLETPAGPLRLENTHLHAQYRTDEYGPERLAQAVELLLGGSERRNEALIVSGDFNGRGDELPRRALRDLGELDDAIPASSEDSVYARSGRDLSIRITGTKIALAETRRLKSGETLPLSDHAAVVVDLELARCTKCERDRRVVSATRSAALASLERAADATPLRVVLALLTAAALLVLGLGLERRRRAAVPRPRRRVTARELGLAVLVTGFMWCAYLGVVYYPTRGKALRAVAEALAKLP
jgi:endonuclease/exonuclease/phosphatase family metal-dependent hydrolase